MITALSVRRKLARPVGVAITVAGTILALTGSASAAVPANAPSAAPATVPAPRSLRTLFTDVRSYARPTMHSAVQGKLGVVGTIAQVTCWTSGMYWKDTVIWYQIASPVPGYVAAFNLAAHFAPAFHVSHCPSPVFRQKYRSLAANLRIRTEPSTKASILEHLSAIGSPVVATCFVHGTRIYGDPVWYRTMSPADGYVSGRFLNTGHDPARGMPHC